MVVKKLVLLSKMRTVSVQLEEDEWGITIFPADKRVFARPNTEPFSDLVIGDKILWSCQLGSVEVIMKRVAVYDNFKELIIKEGGGMFPDMCMDIGRGLEYAVSKHTDIYGPDDGSDGYNSVLAIEFEYSGPWER